MKNKTIRLACAATSLTGLFLASGWPFFKEIVVRRKHRPNGKAAFELSHIKVNHPRHQYGKEYEEGRAWCEMQNMQDCYIKSADGLTLHGSFLPAEKPRRILLLSHGYRGSGFGNFGVTAEFLHENNCSLLFIDQRCCGESGGKYITFGAREQYDVQKWAYYLSERNRDRLPIYLYGKSMGATAVLMAAGHSLPREVKGLIADCGFRSMKGQIQDMAAGWFHLKWVGLLLLRLEIYCRLFAGFRICEADTADALRKNRRPILFFHGLEDTFVTPGNSKVNFNLCRSPRELVMVPGARHLCSAYAAPELYRKKLLRFFERYDRESVNDQIFS